MTNTVHMAWMLGRPTQSGKIPQLLTVCAYAMVSAVLLIVLGGAHSFLSFEPQAQATYLPLAGFAVVLLVVPLFVLGSAAVRLSARTQDRALSSLRLLGATGSQIRIIVMLQAALTALAGALAGVVLYLVCSPLVALIAFQGAPLGGAIFLPVWAVGGALLAVVLLSVVSSLMGLRKLVITPLAVATRRTVPMPSWLRAVITVGALLVLCFVFSNVGVISQDLGVIIVVIVLGFGFGLLILNLIGPWLVAKVGKSKLARAQTPEQLLAARMILESPVQAWRQVSGVAMASFVAVVGGSGAAMMRMAGANEPTGTWIDDLPQDIFTGVLLTLAISFICVAVSATISQCAQSLDRAELYAGLHRLGMDFETMNTARTRSLMIPALTVAIGFAVASVLLVFPLAGLAVIFQPLTVVTSIASVVLGLLLIRVAISVANPRRLLAGRTELG